MRTLLGSDGGEMAQLYLNPTRLSHTRAFTRTADNVHMRGGGPRRRKDDNNTMFSVNTMNIYIYLYTFLARRMPKRK